MSVLGSGEPAVSTFHAPDNLAMACLVNARTQSRPQIWRGVVVRWLPRAEHFMIDGQGFRTYREARIALLAVPGRREVAQ